MITKPCVYSSKQALLLSVNAITINVVQLGMGHHFAVLVKDPVKFTLLRFRFWITQILYKACLQVTKLSLILLYKRIFGSVQWFKRTMQIGVIFLVCYIIEAVLVNIFECIPVAAIYDSSIKGTCINIVPFFLFNAYFATITDFIVLILPMPLLYGLKIPLNQKLALIPVFGMGVVAVTVSALRCAALYAAFNIDNTYFDLTGPMWTIIEMNFAVLCAALPSTRVLLARLFPKQFGTAYIKTKASTAPWESNNYNSGWSKVDRNTVVMTNINKGTSSEALTDEPSPDGIQKTTAYKVEFDSASQR
jgi:hypothetical protein